MCMSSGSNGQVTTVAAVMVCLDACLLLTHEFKLIALLLIFCCFVYLVIFPLGQSSRHDVPYISISSNFWINGRWNWMVSMSSKRHQSISYWHDTTKRQFVCFLVQGYSDADFKLKNELRDIVSKILSAYQQCASGSGLQYGQEASSIPNTKPCISLL